MQPWHKNPGAVARFLFNDDMSYAIMFIHV
jgi:hypothetical protein